MKKSILAFIVCILFAGVALGQTYYSTSVELIGNKSPGEQGTREGIECPPNTIYSHLVDYQTGFTSWSGTEYIIYDKLESTPVNPVNGITFFGICEGSPDRNFTISFYKSDVKAPWTLMATYTVFIAGTYTGQSVGEYYPVYSYSYALPAEISLVAGDCVSVVADGPNYWFWCSASGGDGCVYQAGVGYRCDYGDVAFCLGYTRPVPVSDWALFIGIGLILIFAVVRFRKMT